MPHPIHPLHGRQLRAGSAWCASWGNETVASTAVPGEQPAAVLFFATGWFTLGVSLEQFSGVNATTVARSVEATRAVSRMKVP